LSKKDCIAVIGMGLIGASVLKGLKNKGFELLGVSRSEETVKKALELGIADEASTDSKILKKANVVFVATPINKITETISNTAKIVNSDCIITDCASLKGFVIDFVNNQNFNSRFVGGHPMAGTENKGIDSSDAGLFEGAKWVLTPSRFSNQKDIEKLDGIISKLGAKTLISDAKEHDIAVSLISRLPLIVSQALFGFVNQYSDTNIRELALKLASSGFRDTTRLAATNSELAKDMLLNDKDILENICIDFELYLNDLSEIRNNEQVFADFLQKTSSERKNMYSEQGKNIY
jgi:arogenate dehydrogenase (NADP+)